MVGRTDDEIREQYMNDPSKLSIEEVLYAATLTQNPDERQGHFERPCRLYPNDKRAHNGLAQIAYTKGDMETAKAELAQAAELPEANANAAASSPCREHHLDQAESPARKGPDSVQYNEVLGNLQVARGNFVQAAQTLKGVNTNTAALAQILTKDYVSARQTLNGRSASRCDDRLFGCHCQRPHRRCQGRSAGTGRSHCRRPLSCRTGPDRSRIGQGACGTSRAGEINSAPTFRNLFP